MKNKAQNLIVPLSHLSHLTFNSSSPGSPLPLLISMGPHYQNFSRPLPAHTPPPHVDTNKYNDIEFQALSYESFPLSGPPPKMQEITVPRIGFRPLDGVVLFSLLIAISLIIVIWGECFASIGLNANAGQTCVLKWKIGGLRPIILVGAHTQHPMTELY